MIRMLADHLWQSSLFAIAAALLTLAFRRNRATVRFWLWFAASSKFLIPFTVLVDVGKQLGWLAAGVMTPAVVTQVAAAVGRPLAVQAFDVNALIATPSPAVPASLSFWFAAVWAIGATYGLGRWWSRWRKVAAIVRAGTPAEDGREMMILRAIEHRLGLRRPITLVLSGATLEPGVFGVLNPVMLWPQHLTGRLDDPQIEAIIAHELCHVRRLDNLLAAVHMFVESIFWFHPLVWWVGRRLIDERERACDEGVIALGSAPHVYAQSILRTCELCIEQPMACASGVTGADLRERIEAIMTCRILARLTTTRKLAIAAAALATVVLPVTTGLLGAVSAAQGPRPSFEVASVKPNNGGTNIVSIEGRPGGGMVFTNMPLRGIINWAYDLQDFQLVDAPDWVANERFDINAKASVDAPPALAGGRPDAPSRLMMQSLLEERFKLTSHRDKRPLPIYNLVLARADGKPGPQLKPASVDCNADRSGGRGPGRGALPPGPLPPGDRPACGMMMSPGRIAAGGTPMSRLISPLSMFTRRIVVDKTGLNGNFDIDLVWTPEQMPSGPPPPGVTMPAIDPNGPSIFTALQEQLGLKLESQTGPVDVLVVDRVERPTPD